MSEKQPRSAATRVGQRPSPGAAPRSPVLLVGASILLLSLTLRAPTTAVGPVLTAIEATTGRHPTVLALLTSVPLLCFVVMAPTVPFLLRRISLGTLIACALLAAGLGVLVRSLPQPGLLWLGTVLLGLAVAVASVLAPAVVRAARPGSSRAVLALYTAGLSLGPALAAGLTLPLGALLGGGWRTALATWAVLPLLALACWLGVAGSRTTHRGAGPSARPHPDEDTPEPTTAPRPASVWRDPAAWLLTAYLGLTSLLFYTTAAWLPTILEAGGTAATTAGAVTALAGIVAVPLSFLAPLATRRRATTRTLAVLAPTPIAAGLVVVALVPDARILGAVLIGAGQGASVGIAYALVIVSARSTQHAAALSSMSQTLGVTLAALGPLTLAAGQEALGSWAGATTLLASVPVLQAVIGAVLVRSGSDRDSSRRRPERQPLHL
ncbi:MFS transporter [Georgenia subflava]|uniref:MFS transporter n=1 Tax=Georgenia subflava TaxID=1622177 RepID=A0A6N7EID5_9MICO|nr:MFS transporter [Georgenia subflava]MPV36758.1 MFS transporter [Georgenia subflava]